jgi:hypothetical protein
VCPRSMRCQASMLVSTALLALQCCFVCSHCLLSASHCCSPSPCASSLDAPPGFCAGVNRASRGAVLPCAVAVYPRRQLFSVAVCPRSMRCQASMLVSTAFLALQCCRVQPHCLLSASAVLRRRVRPRSVRRQASILASTALLALQCRRVRSLSIRGVRLFSVAVCPRALDALPGFCMLWCQPGISRCTVLPCAVAVYPRGPALFSVAVCPRLMRCQASGCWRQPRFSR